MTRSRPGPGYIDDSPFDTSSIGWSDVFRQEARSIISSYSSYTEGSSRVTEYSIAWLLLLQVIKFDLEKASTSETNMADLVHDIALDGVITRHRLTVEYAFDAIQLACAEKNITTLRQKLLIPSEEITDLPPFTLLWEPTRSSSKSSFVFQSPSPIRKKPPSHSVAPLT